MKRFLIQTTVFLAVALLSVYALWRLVVWHRSDIMHSPDLETLILGNSQEMCGINDSIWPGALNLSKSADHLEYIYAKLKLVHNSNPGLKRVIVGFDNTLLFKDPQKTHPAENMHPYYFDEYNADEIKHMIGYSSYEWWQNYLTQPMSYPKIKPLFDDLLGRNVNSQQLGIGNTEWFPQHMTPELERESYIKLKPHTERFPDIRLSVYFMQRIVDYCKANNLDLTLVTMPIYTNTAPDTSYKVVKDTYFPDVKHLDYCRYGFSADDFMDLCHLRYPARDSITHVLMHEIQR